jgi:hypothetical protein
MAGDVEMAPECRLGLPCSALPSRCKRRKSLSNKFYEARRIVWGFSRAKSDTARLPFTFGYRRKKYFVKTRTNALESALWYIHKVNSATTRYRTSDSQRRKLNEQAREYLVVLFSL